MIFSKLQGGYWPNVELVASKCHSILSAEANGDDVAPFLASGSKPRSSSPKKSPVKKSVTPAQVVAQPVAQLPREEAPVKPFKLDESQKFLEPAAETKAVEPVKIDSEERPEPTQEAPAEVPAKTEPVVEEKQPEPAPVAVAPVAVAPVAEAPA